MAILLAFLGEGDRKALQSVKEKLDRLRAPLPRLLAFGHNPDKLPARLAGWQYDRLILDAKGNAEGNANQILMATERLLKMHAEEHVWLLVDDSLPAALYEELNTHWQKFAVPSLVPFVIDDHGPVVDVFAHKNPIVAFDWQDSEFLLDLLDEDEKSQLRRALVSPRSVLITGAIGMGKTLLARYIHYHTKATAQGNFVSRNLAGIPETLIEHELYGIKKEVATGVAEREGALIDADGGTLFLDEIAETDLAVQAKLLHVITGRVEPILCPTQGGKDNRYVRVRFIVATNRAGAELDERLRSDLRSRLSTQIHLKPLSQKVGNRLDFYCRAIDHFTQLDFAWNPMLRPRWNRASIQKAFESGSLPDDLRGLRNFVDRIWTERLYVDRPPEREVTEGEIEAALSANTRSPSLSTGGHMPASLRQVEQWMNQIRVGAFGDRPDQFTEGEIQSIVYRCKVLALDIACWFGNGNEARSMRAYGMGFKPSFKRLCDNPDSLHPKAKKRGG